MAKKIVEKENIVNLPKDRIIEKVSWVTDFLKNTTFVPPVSEDEKNERINRDIKYHLEFFKNAVTFLQDNGFTTKPILKKNEKVNDAHQITVGDLTVEGVQFYYFGIRAWLQKKDKAVDKEKAINDFAFIEKKLKEFKELTK